MEFVTQILNTRILVSLSRRFPTMRNELVSCFLVPLAIKGEFRYKHLNKYIIIFFVIRYET